MKYSSWKIPNKPTPRPKAVLEAGYSPLLAALLGLRGIEDPVEAERFLCGSIKCLTDPMQMVGMSDVVSRVKRAIEGREQVAVFGDYDVDGISSTALIVKYLRSKGVSCKGYIPDRLDEGYGLNKPALKSIYESGASLVITVDCGIMACEEAEYAAELGLDMVITDHHECNMSSLPKACAAIDPKIDGNPPETGILAGVGVAFKLACAIEGDAETILSEYADIIALGTIADVMPLQGENRYIVRRGLEMLSKSPNIGLSRLVSGSCGTKRISAITVGYIIAPRINAAGRLGRADIALELLLTEDVKAADRLVAELCELNQRRREIEQSIWEEARGLISEEERRFPIVLASDKWHQGVVGIAASKLAEKFSRPAVMICLDGDIGKGSCRSFGGFNIFEALGNCSEFLETFGGHAFAAGLTIKRENIPAFRKAMAEFYTDSDPIREKTLECDLEVDDPQLLSLESVESLERLEPWGNGNESPILYISGAYLERLTPIGGGKHLKLVVSKSGIFFDCVMFSCRQEEFSVEPGQLVDLAFNPQVNEYRGNRSVQLVILDMRHSDEDMKFYEIISGAEIDPWNSVDIGPNRSDFVRIWRGIESAGGKIEGGVSEIMSTLSSQVRPSTTAVCLVVMRDKGLITIKYRENSYSISSVESDGKVDLETHPLLCRISENREKLYGRR